MRKPDLKGDFREGRLSEIKKIYGIWEITSLWIEEKTLRCPKISALQQNKLSHNLPRFVFVFF